MFERRTASVAALLVSFLLAPATASSGPPRTTGSTERQPERTSAGSPVGMAIARTYNAQALAECLLGVGLTVTSATLTAAPAAVGAFTSGTSVLGLDAGVVLSTGDVDSLARGNLFADMSTDNAAPGDASLDAVLDPGGLTTTFDAAVLVIDFTAAAPGTLNLSYVFGSDEYNEFVDDQFNDLFAIFLDGTAPANNIALTAGACATTTGLKIAINSVNCGLTGTDLGAPNCACYRDNALATIETELDGLTEVLIASTPLTTGAHQLKIAIADAADSIYDAAVFIKCQSGEVPVLHPTWGRLKTLYR
jgi:hypothetical protein